MKKFTGVCLTIVTMVVAALSISVQPAAAITNNEKFVLAVYEDYLFRDVYPSEMSWWTAYLGGGGSRSTVVADVLDGSEFKNLWVIGASQYYIGAPDSQFNTIVGNLNSTSDFVASEVAIVAGATFFANAGGTNSGYVQAVYQKILLRAADPSGLSYWQGRLNAGTATRTYVANYFIRTSESAQKRVNGTTGQTVCSADSLEDASSLAAGSYCIVLDRLANATDTSYWASQLASTDQLPSLWTSLSASAEYYTNAQARY